MAAVPQPKLPETEEEASYVLPSDHRLPGWSVDALLADDKVDEARAELERLLDEGIDSGPGELITPEYIAGLRQRARQRASFGK